MVYFNLFNLLPSQRKNRKPFYVIHCFIIMEESKEERIRMVKALLQTSANEKGEVVTDFGTFKTFQEIGKKLQEIMV